MTPRFKPLTQRAAAYAATLATWALAMAAPAAHAGGSFVSSIDFVPVSLSSAQNARVLLVNLAAPSASGIPPGPCSGQLQFFTAAGSAYGTPQVFTLDAGQYLVGAAPSANVTVAPTSLRARVTFGLQSPDGGRACHAMQAGYEIFDTQTQETKLLSPGVIRGFNPQPDPPG